MKVEINGKTWNVLHVDEMPPDDKGQTDLEGLCDYNCNVFISKWLAGKLLLEVEIHELIHAMDDTLQHGRVTKLGRDLAKVLWKLGWRKTKKSKAKKTQK